MTRRILSAALLALLGMTGTYSGARAEIEEKRVHVQVRNIKQGEELRLDFARSGLLNLLIADIRLSGIATHLEDGEVTLDESTLVVRTDKARINLNITLHARCEARCPDVLVGGVVLPHTAYAMLRTTVQDVTLTKTGDWTLKLSEG